MKTVKLAAPAVDDSGAVRNPVEGALTVSADLAQRWKDAGVLAEDPEDQMAAKADDKPAKRGKEA